MKLHRIADMKLCLLTIHFLLTVSIFNATAQDFGYKPSKDDPKYKLGELSFQHRIEYKPKPMKGEEGNSVLLIHEKDKEALFVSLPKDSVTVKKITEQLRGTLLAELMPGESKNIKWKRVVTPPDKAGKYDVGREKWQAFDGTKRFFIEYHHLKFKNKDIIAGYAFVIEDETPDIAEDLFIQGLDAVSGPAGAGCSKIVASITGEGNISIGMPPPEAAPPRSKN
jgi:hypothetical protein